MGVQSVQMLQSLSKAAEMVVDLELTSSLWELLQFTEERKILARIHLCLLSNQESKLKVVYSQGVRIKSVCVCQETHVLNGVFSLLGVSCSQTCSKS